MIYLSRALEDKLTKRKNLTYGLVENVLDNSTICYKICSALTTYDLGTGVIGWDINRFPNCCGAAIVGNLWISETYQKLHILQDLHKLIIKQAKEFRYGQLFCTIVPKETPSLKRALIANGWEKTSTFVNPHTKNTVETYSYVINKPKR